MHQRNLSSRAKFLNRFEKRRKEGGLNLVSLMDIFTILVFFLLVSSSNVQQLPSRKDVRLPTSTATKSPKETLTVMVSSQSILVQGVKVADVSEVMNSPDKLIAGLQQELQFQASRKPLTPEQQNVGYAITIMGDEKIPFQLLSKIMATCRAANFRQVAFAAMQKAKGKG